MAEAPTTGRDEDLHSHLYLFRRRMRRDGSERTSTKDGLRDKVPCAIATEYEALNMEVDATTWVKLDPQVSGQSFKSLIEDLQIDSTYKLIYHNEFKRVYPPRALSKVKAYDLRATHKKILTWSCRLAHDEAC